MLFFAFFHAFQPFEETFALFLLPPTVKSFLVNCSAVFSVFLVFFYYGSSVSFFGIVRFFLITLDFPEFSPIRLQDVNHFFL